MKKKLYEVLDRILMTFSPLVENIFDQAELLNARREARRNKRRKKSFAWNEAARIDGLTYVTHR